MALIVEDAAIPDSKLARAVTEYIRDSETDLLFNHSSRVYHFGALAGVKRSLKFDRELLYAGAQAPVGFLQVVCERHIHLNELAYIRGERLKLPRMGFNHLF